MNTNQLLLLALNCINEKREPSHTERSHIYVFYRTQVLDMKLSISNFITQLQINDLVYDSEKKAAVLSFLDNNLEKSVTKFNDRVVILS